jgi:N-acyl-phosphatidylethanolamine-hydrolysing phospholipase D
LGFGYFANMGRGHFINPHLGGDRRSLFDFIRWKMGHFRDVRLAPPPEGFVYPCGLRVYDRNLPSAIWVGHSSFLIDCKGLNILTDPVWSNHCAPLNLKTFRRHEPPPFPLSALPKIDVVLISHNHYDHLDEPTVRKLDRLQPDILWVLPKGLSRWFKVRGITRCLELNWWDRYDHDACKITAVPAQHFSGRTPWDRNRTLWNGYVVEVRAKKFYFVGDTGYNEHDFKAIGKRFAPIDLSLIPIGTYIPYEFMSTVHSSPEDAVNIHLDVQSQLSLGMHWNTFRLSEEPLDRPPYDLYLTMKKNNLPFDTFLPISTGIRVNW